MINLTKQKEKVTDDSGSQKCNICRLPNAVKGFCPCYLQNQSLSFSYR